MCANTTIGVLCFKCLTSAFIHSSCSWPSVPSPPAFKFSTFTSPMKCTPFLSKLYHPAPLAFFPYRSRYCWPLSLSMSCSPGTNRYEEHVLRTRAFQDLVHGVEFFRFRQVADVARMQHELRWHS